MSPYRAKDKLLTVKCSKDNVSPLDQRTGWPLAQCKILGFLSLVSLSYNVTHYSMQASYGPFPCHAVRIKMGPVLFVWLINSALSLIQQFCVTRQQP